MKQLLVFCTFPNIESARQIGTLLVERQLAACVSLVPGVRSIYRWKGEVKSDAEMLGLIKTTDAAYPALEATLSEAHPYDTPEIVAVPFERAYHPYLEWLTASTLGHDPD